MPESSGRLAELERRVQFDPSPFVFAQLAEEYRRAHRIDDAIACCRTGLSRHPGYLLARLILGRALRAASELPEAIAEFERVVAAAPDHLAATRELAELYEREGRRAEALEYYRRALALARNDASLEATIAALSEPVTSVAAQAPIADAPRAARDRVDFDALLATLGRADQQPPPLMEALLTDPLALAAQPRLSESADAAADDPFRTLERSLRERLESAPAGRGAPAQRGAAVESTRDSIAARIDAAVIADLEAWLRALARDRSP